jgi:hypothetical protein
MCELHTLVGCRKPTPGVSVRGKVIAAANVVRMPKTEKQIGEAGAAATPAVPYEYKLGDGVQYGEAFTLKTGAKWVDMEFVISSAELSAQLVGTDGFKNFSNELMGKFVGTSDEVRDFVQELNNCCGGWLIAIPTLDNPDFAAVIGSVDSPCAFDMPKMTTAKKAGEESSTEVKFTDLSGRIWRSYPIALGLPTT